MASELPYAELAAELETSRATRTPLRQLSRRFPEMDIEDGYRVQREWTKLRLAQGQRVVGRKIGLTSRAMQVASQISEPDFAPLLECMFFEAGTDIAVDQFIAPRVEVELAFVIDRPLCGPGVSTRDVLRATEHVLPAIEIIDARIEQFDRETRAPRKVVDTIADYAACAGVVLGPQAAHADDLDLRWTGAMLYRNGTVEETGLAAGVLNHPATGVAWLANRLAKFDEQLERGDIVLAGSFTRPVPMQRGDVFHADYGRLGAVTFRAT
jgi:2-oxo-hept-3-ene-1,7-dioate hydratase